MMRLSMVVAAWLFSSVGLAQQGFDELLKQVQESSQAAAQINQEREQRFLRNRDQQAALLKQAERDQAQAQKRADGVKQRFDKNQKDLAELKTRLADAVGELGQMYAGIRQASGDFRTVAENSLITAQFPARLEFLERLASQKELPSIRQIDTLWYALTQELAEGARVTEFEAELVDVYGQRQTTQVTRVGPFTAFADGQYMTVIPGSARLQILPRQPAGKYLRLAEDFSGPGDTVLIDPSSGRLLEIEGERPSLSDRIDQGGIVGYLIIALAIIGILVALFQLLFLTVVGRRVSRQLKASAVPSTDNPLGRVLATFKDDAHLAEQDDPELLELRLSEAVLRESPRLERFQGLLKLIAAVAPLLGLLGTVTGMIATFQAITVFGTGDPKLMAGGISQALVTTVMGLLTAIPILFITSLLSSRSRALVQILDEQSAGLLARRMEALDQVPPAARI